MLYKRQWKKILAVVVGVFLAALGVRLIGPMLVDDPVAMLRSRHPATLYTDSSGDVIYAEPGYDHQWRIEVGYHELPPELLKVFFAVEDQRFWSHNGVDWLAVGRATLQNLSATRVISGSSTLTMQVARMGDYHARRNWSNKIRQIFQAWKIESRYSKVEILHEYLNHLPFGGKIIGIEAAAQYYFNRPAAELNLGEMALLAGLPQRPNALRPDRHLQQARTRQRYVLERLETEGMIPPDGAGKIWRETPLRWRDFSRPAPFKGKMRGAQYRFSPHFFQLAHAQMPDAAWIPTGYDAALSEEILGLLQQQLQAAAGVEDAACVVIDNQSAEVKVLIGTLDFFALHDGMVNAATSLRQPGSTLKPFIYGCAIDRGLITPLSRLDDHPLALTDYRPDNFDGTFQGAVTAQQALAESLNTPAVRLLHKLGVPPVLATLQEAGFRHLHERTGLALALGGCEVSLLELTNAFAAIARGGVYREARFARRTATEAAPPERAVRFWEAGSAELVSRMLLRPLPDSGTLAAAWKTGTSNGNRDAWCIAWNNQFTVGIWFGNKNGFPNSRLVGVSLAAPTAGKCLQLLYRNRSLPAWPPPDSPAVVAMPLCAVSGLAPAPECARKLTGPTVAALPPERCTLCRQSASAPLAILTPRAGSYRIPAGGEKLTLQLSCAQNEAVHWYVDGKFERTAAEAWQREFPVGAHQLRAVSSADGNRSATIGITVTATKKGG